MSYEKTETHDTIVCDKCGHSDTVKGSDRGREIFNLGWLANFRAKKYVHICYGCQPRKRKDITTRMIERFG